MDVYNSKMIALTTNSCCTKKIAASFNTVQMKIVVRENGQVDRSIAHLDRQIYSFSHTCYETCQVLAT